MSSRRPSRASGSGRNSSSSRPRGPPSEISWVKGKTIGCGGFGTVYLGMDANTGQLIAGKEFNFEVKEKKQLALLAQLESEIRVMKDLSHENIVQYRGAERREKFFYIFMEYVPGGSVRSLLDQFGALQPKVAARFTRQILEGLEFLHQKKVVHRDIKAANVLVNVDSVCKLADFGSSETFEEAKGIKGTPYWMAPEVVTGTRGIGWQADIWSLGCMMVEMLTGNRPFAEFDNPMKAMNFIANSTERVTVPASITESCKSAADFIALCLQRDPLQRPPASALLSHYFIRSNVELSMFFDASQMDGESGDVFGASSRREESASFYSLAEPQQPDSREEAAQQEMIRASLIKDVETKTNVVVLSQGQQPNKDGEPGAPAASPVEILISDGAPVPLGGSQARSEVTMLDAVNGGGGMSTRPSGRQGSVIIAGSISGQEQHQSAAAHQPAARLVPHVMESLLRSLQAEMMLAANAGHSIGGRTVREGNADDENDDEAAGEESDQEDVSSGGRIKKKKDEEGEDGGKKQSHHPAGGGGSARQRQQSSSGVSIRASSHLPWTSLQIFRSLVLVAMLGAFSGLLALLAKSW